jgi:hypothetical protein
MDESEERLLVACAQGLDDEGIFCAGRRSARFVHSAFPGERYHPKIRNAPGFE